MSLKRFSALMIALALTLGLFGCAGAPATTAAPTTEASTASAATTAEVTTAAESTAATTEADASVFPLTFTDDKGTEITLETKPEKVAALSGTTLYLYTLTGGKVIAGPSLSKAAPRAEGTPDYPELGHMANINVEELVTLEPDFVILQSMQTKIIPVLEQNGIPYMFFSAKTLEDIKAQILLFSKINDRPARGEEIVKALDKRIAETLEKLPENREHKIAIVYVSGRGISLKLPNSIAGDVARIIGLKNITEGLTPEKMGMDSVPFDLEMLVEENPEFVFVTSMVSADEKVEDVLLKHMQDSSAWSSLDAVANGKMYYLPQSHFLFNPVDQYGDAVKIMAEYLWPEAFK